MLLLKQSVLPGGSWVEIGVAALFTSIEPEHRNLLVGVLTRKWRALRPGGAHA